MKNADIFGWLVSYHCHRNLGACIPHAQDGRITDEWENVTKEGTENEKYKGLLLVSNGDTLLETLIKGGLVHTHDISPPTHIASRGQFYNHLDKQIENDGAFIFDGKNRRIFRAYELNNNPESLKSYEGLLVSAVPHDFVYSSGDMPVERKDLGTKTRLAIKLPQAYPNIETFQIKRTAYANLGIGKITHFDKDGLAQEFYFRRGEYGQIEGVHKKYERVGGELKAMSTSAVDVSQYLDGIILLGIFGSLQSA